MTGHGRTLAPHRARRTDSGHADTRREHRADVVVPVVFAVQTLHTSLCDVDGNDRGFGAGDRAGPDLELAEGTPEHDMPSGFPAVHFTVKAECVHLVCRGAISTGVAVGEAMKMG
jgi:hypothetical protein